MLRDGLLKENIDGEALLWAYSRLNGEAASKKILVVLSDGAPVDDSTHQSNSAALLDEHLRSVTNWIETESNIDLIGIGLDHNPSRYYRRSVVTSPAELGGVLFPELERASE